ncbi:MAG: SUMF1/EgtB/PvdO family nonheme iron enzyme [Betaproteobacteria bacterium]|nr:SUMF1/EgtB/PvdO family nonheme iron enzyme [Betaproteobacteria bacterium]
MTGHLTARAARRDFFRTPSPLLSGLPAPLLRGPASAGGAVCSAPRVLRGGSWNNNRDNCRCAARNDNHPDNRNDNRGFRVCCAPHIIRPLPAPRCHARPGCGSRPISATIRLTCRYWPSLIQCQWWARRR